MCGLEDSRRYQGLSIQPGPLRGRQTSGGFRAALACGQLPFARMFECAPSKALLSIENSIVKVLILLEEVTQWFSTLITG